MRQYSFLFSLFMSISVVASAQQETSVLFIGNSYTFMNNMPFLFKAIAESKGHRMHVDTVVEGGKNLEYHASQEETYRVIKSRKWDYVVVQGHSNELAQPDSKVDKNTFPFAKQLIDSIRGNSECTQVVLYMTWGYKYGNPKWGPIATYDSMQMRIRNQYMRFADLLNTAVSPVGEVWRTIRSLHPGINLYDPDNHHPSLEGSYVSACTFYAAIFGESPSNNRADIPLKSDVREIIERTASTVVLNQLGQWRHVPNRIRPIAGFDLYVNGKTLKIYNSSKHYTILSWEFGDGTVSVDEHPTKEYAAPGNYTVKLRISNHCQEVVVERTIQIN